MYQLTSVDVRSVYWRAVSQLLVDSQPMYWSSVNLVGTETSTNTSVNMSIEDPIRYLTQLMYIQVCITKNDNQSIALNLKKA